MFATRVVDDGTVTVNVAVFPADSGLELKLNVICEVVVFAEKVTVFA